VKSIPYLIQSDGIGSAVLLGTLLMLCLCVAVDPTAAGKRHGPKEDQPKRVQMSWLHQSSHSNIISHYH
jgi:hypothetical protein